MVGAGGFDPPTSCSQGRRASWLRYTPTARTEVVAAGAGVEPARQVSLLRSPDATPCCSPGGLPSTRILPRRDRPGTREGRQGQGRPPAPALLLTPQHRPRPV